MNPVIPSSPSLLQMLLGLYGFLLPLVLYVVWSTLALWDLGRRQDVKPAAVWGWAIGIFLLPFAGPLAYLVTGATTLSRPLRLAAVVGGAATYVLVLALGAGIGGIA
ncbi:MAG: PLDc N-terminal domain-containing protein [Proteobacteria bacterium]|nr:PLDc N-terminal domain-containing protein [Pseudomonadota bacterium]